ncbi:MAG TPA: type IV pilus assembly protein PilM [Candidatus Tectomicrobia bacterium]|nr:type IV pilus assembly protein PilM [Candidatus Tectomicrobia bacterium]
MWFQRAKPLTGIDIGSHAIKLVRFSFTDGASQLLNLAMLPIPPDSIADGVIGDIPAVQGALQRLIELEKIADKDVALALSGHSVIVKKVQMVRMSEAELANAMPYEAEQHIPFDVYDVNTDFQILTPAEVSDGKSGQMDVLLAAARKGRVEELSLVAQGANLNPVVIDVDMLALINAFELNYPDDIHRHVISLVHLGASMMTVLILKDGLSTFQRDITLGGNQYTAALQKALPLGREEAEALKLGARPWRQAESNVLAVLHKVTEEVVTEIQRSFEFYLASASDEPIEKVYVSGGCSRLKGLAQVLSSRLRLPVEPLNPFRRIAISEEWFDLDYVNDIGPMVAVAAGLALRKKDDR